MTSLEQLEAEWREAYEASIAARVQYRAVAASPQTSVNAVDMARERYDRALAVREWVMAKIERHEAARLGAY